MRHPLLQLRDRTIGGESLAEIMAALAALLDDARLRARQSGGRIGIRTESSQWVIDLELARVFGGPGSPELDQGPTVDLCIEGDEGAVVCLLTGNAPADTITLTGDERALTGLARLLRP